MEQKRRKAEVHDSIDVIFLDLEVGAKLMLECLSICRVYCGVVVGMILLGNNRAISMNLSLQIAFCSDFLICWLIGELIGSANCHELPCSIKFEQCSLITLGNETSSSSSESELSELEVSGWIKSCCTVVLCLKLVFVGLDGLVDVEVFC